MAKCTNCGNSISTAQELTSLLYKNYQLIRDAILANITELIALITKIGNANGPLGITAGPLNLEDIPCPHCGSTNTWVDS